ncbi:hypothetical protein LF1_47270 [Rubripirellula obstinata]|uniref:Uncharacterized protein n=1 Tax=Rubripirellula obstinata TaxID=406547 RepID=A0A5B1CQB4_9BACT|nr:hypothetical protein [Rubripirellula obstinata]KAA1262165.1 hypothetical protein LF1_47270 [Rubripirellula obstinata]
MPAAPPPASPASTSNRSATQKNARNKSAAGETADRLIAARIDEACRALWWGELVRHSLKLVLGIVISIGAWILLDHWVLSRPSLSGVNSWARIAALVSLVAGVFAYAWLRIFPLIGKSISPEYAARSLEKNYPSLRQSLTSYVTLKESTSQNGLQGRVVQSIGTSTAGYLKRHDELPDEATGNMKLWLAAAVALASLVFYAAASPKNSLQSVRRLIKPTASIAPVTRVSIKDVTPGDAEAIAGRSVQVTADIRGLKPDETALCEIQYSTGAKQTTMQRDESLGAFGFIADITLDHSASGDVPYLIKAGDATSQAYEFRVKDVPVVALDSVNYRPPGYTGIAPFTRTSGSISAIEGTAITLNATTNRPIARAAIEFNPKTVGDTTQATDGAIEMVVGDDGRSLSVDFALQIDGRRSASVRRDSYRIRVWDEANANNPDPIIYPIDIIADLPPEVAIMLPTRVPKDVPIGTQQIIEVHASDADFGLSEIRLQITSGIRNVGEPVLWQDVAGKRGNQVAEYRFRPAELGLSVGDVVRITAVAIDNKSSEANDQVQGNRSKTDPIELRIVASDEMPPNEDAAGEGLSEPDDQPASDPNSSEENSGDGAGEGEQQQGGGGAEGDQGSSQTGESGQQGSGGGEGDQSEKNEGESQGEGAQSGGEGQGENKPSGGKNSTGENSPGESTPGESSPGEPGEGGAGESEPMQGEPGEGEPSEGQPGEGQPGEGNPSGQQDGSKQGAGQDSQQNQSGQNGEGQTEPQQGESAGENGSSGESGEQSSPKHDGEAFERIQDYLNQKQQEQQQGQSGQQDGQQGEQPESGEPSQGQSPNQSPAGKESGQQSGESDSSNGAPSESKSSDAKPSESEQGQPADSNAMPDDPSGQSESGQGDQSQDSSNQSSGQENASENAASEQQAGEQNPAKQGDAPEQGSEQKSDQGSEQGTDSSSDGSDQGSSDQGSSEKPSGEPKEGQPGSESTDGNSDQTGTPTDDDSATQSRSPKPSSQGRPGSGDGSGEGTDAESSQQSAENSAANDEYTRKATDMVLDYLDQTRDAPDQELLDRLNWTEQDLKQFQDRWKDIGDLDAAKNKNDPAANRATEEALRSLGLRPPSTGKNRSTSEQSDSLKGIRDSGNRRRPPAALRDAFDAFRRQMGNGS